MSKRLIDLVFAAGLLALSIWFWMIADGFPTSPRFARIDTAFWPKIIFSMLVLVTLLITIDAGRGYLKERKVVSKKVSAPPDWSALVRMAAMGLLVFAYYIGFGQIGFVLSTLAFLSIAAFMIPTGKPWIKAVFAPAFTIFLTLMFAHGLGLPLPRGQGVFYDLSLLIY